MGASVSLWPVVIPVLTLLGLIAISMLTEVFPRAHRIRYSFCPVKEESNEDSIMGDSKPPCIQSTALNPDAVILTLAISLIICIVGIIAINRAQNNANNNQRKMTVGD